MLQRYYHNHNNDEPLQSVAQLPTPEEENAFFEQPHTHAHDPTHEITRILKHQMALRSRSLFECVRDERALRFCLRYLREVYLPWCAHYVATTDLHALIDAIRTNHVHVHRFLRAIDAGADPEQHGVMPHLLELLHQQPETYHQLRWACENAIAQKNDIRLEDEIQQLELLVVNSHHHWQNLSYRMFNPHFIRILEHVMRFGGVRFGPARDALVQRVDALLQSMHHGVPMRRRWLYQLRAARLLLQELKRLLLL